MKLRAEYAQALVGSRNDYDRLIHEIGDARFVLIGEASHGTHEFYAERAAITRRLIEEKGFNAVAAEADWPDAYRVNRYVHGHGDDPDASAALSGFKRFPAWMWRNAVVLDFATWLRERNSRAEVKAGFYGLDLYSMFTSAQSVLAYLDRVDPAAAEVARRRYACFDHFAQDSQAYGYATAFGMRKPCELEVVRQLVELRKRAGEYLSRDGHVAAEEFFDAEQNAKLVIDAEQYYRTMFQGGVSSWNLRDRHMAQTLESLAEHLERRDGYAKIAVWAHNSHLGDARATEMGRRGELNLGELVRELHPRECVNIGFSTYMGTVTAASDWDAPAETKSVRPGLPSSYEDLFHSTGSPRFLLMLHAAGLPEEVHAERLQRAIGVIYRPETERQSHYFQAHLVEQFDYMIHIDETRALEALDRVSRVAVEPPETFPTGM
jgi:erythromycin esterase-like protein